MTVHDGVHDGVPAARQIVAHPPFWGSGLASKTGPLSRKPGKAMLYNTVIPIVVIAVGLLVLRSVALSGQGTFVEFLPMAVMAGGILLVLGYFAVYTMRHAKNKDVVLNLTADGISLGNAQHEVFPFREARLGSWMSMGTALHLQSGQRRLVIGFRDRRVSSRARLDAPQVGYGLEVDVDAWLWAQEGEEVLAAVARRSGLDVSPPGPGERIRCLLYPNALQVQQIKPWQFGRQQRFAQAMWDPALFLDLGDESAWLVDPLTNTVVATMLLAHVRATPAIHRPTQRHLLPTAGHVLSDTLTNALSTEPEMVVSAPGMAPLTIGCRDYVGTTLRFAWLGDVAPQEQPAAYAVSGADWLALVERFGLSRHLSSCGPQG